VDDLTRLILVNAVYLKAPWSIPFNEDATADGSFTTSAGETVRVPMMWSTHTMAYAHGDGWQAVDLAYLGNTLSMVLILPDDVEAFVRDMDGARLASIVAGLSGERVALTMPRFGIETRASLPDVLKAMGMPTAFTDGAADFSGITTEERILITEVIHQANIDVDEEGTEASAATAVIGGVTGGPPPVSVELRLDRPFLFALRDVETGVVLFLGQVGDPSTRS
jgi:serpin B